MKDIIIHETIHKFNFADRFKILIGKKLRVSSKIETEHEHVKLTGKVECVTLVERLFTRKKKGMITKSHLPEQSKEEEKRSCPYCESTFGIGPTGFGDTWKCDPCGNEF